MNRSANSTCWSHAVSESRAKTNGVSREADWLIDTPESRQSAIGPLPYVRLRPTWIVPTFLDFARPSDHADNFLYELTQTF